MARRNLGIRNSAIRSLETRSLETRSLAANGPNGANDRIGTGRMRVLRVVPRVKALCGANPAAQAAGTSGSGVRHRRGNAQREPPSARSEARSARMEIVHRGYAATREHGDQHAALLGDRHATQRALPGRGQRAASSAVGSADLLAAPKAGPIVDRKAGLIVDRKADPKAGPRVEPNALASRAWANPEPVPHAMANPALAGRVGAKVDSKSQVLANPAFASPVQAVRPQVGAVQARAVRMAPLGSNGLGHRL